MLIAFHDSTDNVKLHLSQKQLISCNNWPHGLNQNQLFIHSWSYLLKLNKETSTGSQAVLSVKTNKISYHLFQLVVTKMATVNNSVVDPQPFYSIYCTFKSNSYSMVISVCGHIITSFKYLEKVLPMQILKSLRTNS